MISRREGQSSFLDKIVETESIAKPVAKTASTSAGITKTANVTNHPAEKVADAKITAKTNHPSEKQSNSNEVKKTASKFNDTLSLLEVRVARRTGGMLKVAGRTDLYQEANTENYWKISEDKASVVRTFDENNGLATK